MIELIIFAGLITLIVLTIRSGKVVLENPLIIERAGQYHITLAPQLNLALPFIEAIAKQLDTPREASQNSATQCFEVRDRLVTAHSHDLYLLAITLRNGMLYFQAITPHPLVRDKDTPLKTLMDFANAVLARLPATGDHDAAIAERIVAAADTAAQQFGIGIKQLTQV